MTTLRGCWWNVWQDARKKADGAPVIASRVKKLVIEHDLDWLCLQEVYQYDRYGADGDLVQLIHAITGWNYVFVPSTAYSYSIGYKQESNNYVEGIAIFTRLPIVWQRTTLLGSHPHRSGSQSSKYLLELELKADNGQTLIVGNTHWTFMANRNRGYRRQQMQTFIEHMHTLSSKMPYAVGGDFNTFAAHPIISELRKLFTLRTGTPLHPTWMFNGKSKHLLRSNIDYIGVPLSNPLQFKAFTVLMERSPSDHAPLIGTFGLDD